MWRKLVLLFITCLMEQYNAQIHCKDIHQHVVSQGLHYIPGTNPCTLCVCDKGGPKWCKSVLCAPPQNCKSFQVGTLCCEFKCLDDILTAHDDTYDVALRFIASAVTAILSLSLLFFLFHRLKRRKVLVHQNQQLNDDQRSLNSIGYIAGSLGYLPESIGYLGSGTSELEFHYEESNSQYSLWKPPGNYFPRGEAPPPYEEAVRTAQLENDIINSQIRLANSLSNTLNVPTRQVQTAQESVAIQSNIPCRHECPTNVSSNNSTQQYANVIVQNVTVHNTDDSTKLEEYKHRILNAKSRTHHSQHEKNVSKNTHVEKHDKSYENVPVASTKFNNTKRDRPTSSGYKNQKVESYEYNVDKPVTKSSRYDVMLDNKLETNIRKNDKSRGTDSTAKSNLYDEVNCYENTRHHTILNIPDSFNLPFIKGAQCREPSHSTSKIASRELRKLKVGERSESNIRNLTKHYESKDMPLHRTLPKNLRELLANTEQVLRETSMKTDENLIKRSHSSSYEPQLLNNSSKSHNNLTEMCMKNITESFNDMTPLPPAPPNFAVDSNWKDVNTEENLSFISYQCLSSSQDEDDYRSECENCKSSGFTIPDDEETDVLNETMTLQRRPLESGEELSYYRTSLTLPTNTRKSRAVVTNSNRENWFTSMQETSSSEEND